MQPEDEKQAIETISLSIPSAPRFLRIARCLVAELAESAGFSLPDRDKICIAVGEACSNIIRHSYKGKTDGTIDIMCQLYESKIVIRIRDYGEKIDLSRIRPIDEPCLQPGGLGVHMIKCMMDIVEYDTGYDVGTEICMTKYLRPSESENGS